MSYNSGTENRPDFRNKNGEETNLLKTAEALQIVDDNLNLNRNNLETIFAAVADRPVIIISIVGDTRRGKSFLLNLIMQYLSLEDKEQWFTGNHSIKSKGFEWSNSPSSLTHGIWMWSQPLTVKGIDHSILLMDSQGTFGNNMDKALSAKIVALSALPSSIVIYNVKGFINSNDLTNLDCFAKFAETCSTLNGDKEPFQKLMFLVRDWELAGYEFGFAGGKNYIVDTLRSTTEEKEVNRRILASFSNPTGFLMPHPGLSVARGTVSRLDEIPIEFKEVVKNFIEGLFTKNYMEPKKVNGKILTGKQLMDYFANLITLYKSRADLTPSSIIEAGCEIAIIQAKQYYRQELLKYNIYAKQNLRADYQEFNVRTMFKILENFATNPIRHFIYIKSEALNQFAEEMLEIYVHRSRELRASFVDALKLYKITFTGYCHTNDTKTKREFLEAHHVSLIAALRQFVRDEERSCDVRDDDTVLLNKIWDTFIDEYTRIKKEKEYKMLLENTSDEARRRYTELVCKVERQEKFIEEKEKKRDLFKAATARAFSSYNFEVKKFLVLHRGTRYELKDAFENKHKEVVDKIQKELSVILRGFVHNQEIDRYLIKLLRKIEDEKERFTLWVIDPYDFSIVVGGIRHRWAARF